MRVTETDRSALMQATGRARRKAVWGWVRGGLVAALAALTGPACGSLTESGRAASYLIIENLRGASGAKPDEMSSTLASDVRTKGGVFEDPGEVTFRLALKDPGGAVSPLTPSSANYITVTHYRVVYRRTDGRNTPGVDVPYPFEGGMTVTAVTGTVSASFVLVRAQAKLEPPLAALVGAGGAIVISTTAEVTFYGHDQAGTPVSVTGYITVNFADWADPES